MGPRKQLFNLIQLETKKDARQLNKKGICSHWMIDENMFMLFAENCISAHIQCKNDKWHPPRRLCFHPCLFLFICLKARWQKNKLNAFPHNFKDVVLVREEPMTFWGGSKSEAGSRNFFSLHLYTFHRSWWKKSDTLRRWIWWTMSVWHIGPWQRNVIWVPSFFKK